ncbi:hypothetical protein ACWEIJ_36580 [Lentzea sp. NPDC004789]
MKKGKKKSESRRLRRNKGFHEESLTRAIGVRLLSEWIMDLVAPWFGSSGD